MRYVSYRSGGQDAVGELRDDVICPLLGITELSPAVDAATLAGAPRARTGHLALSDVRLRPVVPRPEKIICVGLNYHAHVEETGRDLPQYPVLFTKFASSLIAAGDAIMVPPESTKIDYEAELAVVIGSTVRRAPRAEAMAAVLGYTIANDVTVRDYQYKTHQWLQGKSWPATTPLGPTLVTPDALDPADLSISLSIDGEELQRSRTSRLIFDIAELVSTISTFTTLVPGDLILTGTPGGVGFRRDPQVFLRPGNRVVVEIEGLGRLENPVALEVDRVQP